MTTFTWYGLAFIALGLLWAAWRMVRLSGSTVVMGSVLDMPVMRSRMHGEVYFLEVLFRDLEGAPRRYRTTWGSSVKRHAIGDAIPVFYRNRDPEFCGIADFAHVYGLGAYLVYVGIALVLFPVIWRFLDGVTAAWIAAK